jgi:streptogramin lyase
VSPVTTKLVLIITIVVVISASVAAFAFISPGVSTSTSTSTTTSSSSPAPCSQPTGVTRVQLSLTKQSAEVSTFALPKPLKSPNSIFAAPDGSVWFGEVALRGVAHLFLNGTLVEYPWPSSYFSSQMVCYDVSELWGLVMWHGAVWTTDAANDQLVSLSPGNDSFTVVPMAAGVLPRFLAVDTAGNLWFTESSTRTQVGVLSSPGATPQYFDVPAGAGQISASILIHNSSLAYVVTVS